MPNAVFSWCCRSAASRSRCKLDAVGSTSTCDCWLVSAAVEVKAIGEDSGLLVAVYTDGFETEGVAVGSGSDSAVVSLVVPKNPLSDSPSD